MTQKLSTEYSAKVYDDGTGGFVQIGEDTDGLDLCVLSASGELGGAGAITLSWEHADQLANAIKALVALRGQNLLA